VHFSSNFFDFDANFFGIWTFLVFLRKVSWSAGIFLWKIGPFCLLARRLLISAISAPQLASFFTKNAYHRNYCSYLTGFCSFDCNFIGPCGFTRGCIDDFNQTGLSRRTDSTKGLIYFKTLVYIKSRAAVPSSLFTVVTVTGVVVTYLMLLRLTGFVLAVCISLKHGLHEGHAIIAP
jgi:hypothetical protein